jgi:hypothetical protein
MTPRHWPTGRGFAEKHADDYCPRVNCETLLRRRMRQNHPRACRGHECSNSDFLLHIAGQHSLGNIMELANVAAIAFNPEESGLGVPPVSD